MTETEPQASGATAAPTLAQRLTAYTFLGAFGLTVLTVVLTGLAVRSPSSSNVPETPSVTLTLGEPRRIDLTFPSRFALDDAAFLVELPEGVEVEGHEGQRRIEGRTPLVVGENVLPVSVVARSGPGGQLAARIQHARQQNTLVVDLKVVPH